MDRRAFLLAGAAGITAQLTPKAPAQTPEPAVITSSVMLWTLQGTFEEKMEAAARAGFQSVELVGEHVEWSDAQMAAARNLARSFRMGMDTIIATPDWKKRPVSMVDPAQRENFLGDVRKAITFALKLEIPQIILMSGDEIPGRSREQQYANLLEGTKRAGDLAEKANVTLVVEPLNAKVDHPGFFLTTCAEGLKLVREADNPRVKLLFDLYHEQVQTGSVIQTAVESAPLVAVYHVADSPGRHDPGAGGMNYSEIYKAIKRAGYSGYITMEYLPLGDQIPSLKKAVDGMRAALA